MNLAVLKNYRNVGKLHGKGEAFSSGYVKHFEFDDIKKLGNLVRKVAKDPKMCICVGNFPKDGKVLPKDKAKIGEMSRTKDTVNGGNILVIDNDSGDDFDINIFAKYWDTFKGAGYVDTLSGSTLLGKKKNGTHTYFIVRGNVAQLKKAMEFMEAICILENYAKIEFYKTGRAVIKTPIDLSLAQPSRLVYEDDVEPIIVDGDIVPLSRLPDNYKELMKKAQTLKDDMLDDVKDEELKLHKAYILKHRKVELSNNLEIQKSLDTFNEYKVDENFPLHIRGKYVGDVRDLLSGDLKEILFSDLYEPDYDNGSQKAKYYPDSKTFFSQAHGGIKYEIVVSDEFNNEMLQEFLKVAPHLTDAVNIDENIVEVMQENNNIKRAYAVKQLAIENGVTPTSVERELKRLKPLKEEFDKFYDLWLQGEYENTVNHHSRLKEYYKYVDKSHYVNNGSKNMIIRHYKDDGNNIAIAINSVQVEAEFYSDRKSTIMTIDDETNLTTFKQKCTVDLFVNGCNDDVSGIIPPAKRYSGVEFAPNKELNVAYNLFQGFNVEPQKGDLTIWEDTMTKAYGTEHYEYLMDWFSHMYQRPNEKVMFAVVVKGLKGSGKNTFEETLGRKMLPNPYYMRTANKEQLFGKFNKQLMSNLLIVGQEIVWGGDYNHDSILKDMITESSRTLEIKGQDSFTVNNYSRLYITSNADWVVPATKDERRFYVASTTGKVSKRLWTKLYRWLSKSESIQALMYEMMNRDLSNFNHIKCPETEELREQQRETLYGVDSFVKEAEENGFFGEADNGIDTIMYQVGNFVSTSELLYLYKKYNPRDGKIYANKFSQKLSDLGFIKHRLKSTRGFLIPTDLTV